MAEMNGPHIQPGGQPASGGLNSGSVTGGFEMVSSSMGIGGGAGLSPPCSNIGSLSMTDVTLEQALARMQDLKRENAELREYLKENNEMMKKQFETLSQWKQKVHNANVMNRDKFEQTRALITALRAENEDLQVKLRENVSREDSLTSKIKTMETELNTIKTAKAASDQLAYNVVKQAEQQGVEVGEEETQMRETVYVASAEKEEKILELEEQVSKLGEELSQTKDRATQLEHDNTQFRNNTDQLLKDLESTQQLKQQIQKENQDLRQETVELRLQVQSMLAESKNSLQRNQAASRMVLHQLQPSRDNQPEDTNMPIAGNSSQDGSMGRTPDGTLDDWQETSATVTAEVEQLRKHLDAEKHKVESLQADMAAKELEISELQGQLHLRAGELETLQAQHQEKLQQLQHEHDAQVEQMERQRTADPSIQHQQGLMATHAEDVQTLRSQVLTLINEVHDTQNKLAAAQRTIESKTARVKELEAYGAQVVSESRSHVHVMQQTLAMGERQLMAEQQDHAATKQQMNDLRKSFNQLVSDYKEVLDTFDQYKAEQEQRMRSSSQSRQQMDTINHLTAQVVAAEEAINMREDRIKKLQQDMREKDETVAVLQAQAEVFKSDFAAEREARSRLVTEKERIAQELEAEQLKNQGLVDQLTRYTQQQLHDMQLRASQGSSAGRFLQPHYGYSHPEHFMQGGGYGAGGGGDAGAGGANVPTQPANFNNLSTGEATGQRTQAQHFVGGSGMPNYAGGQNYVHGQNFAGGQAYGAGQTHGAGDPNLVAAGQNYGGGGQNYGGGQQYAGGSGADRMAGQNRIMQPVYPSPDYVEMHSQYQQPQNAGGGGTAQPAQHDEEEHTLYICPSCDQRLPDYDTLAIHVQDCLEQNLPDTARH